MSINSEVIGTILQDAENKIEHHLFHHLSRDEYIAQAEVVYKAFDVLRLAIKNRPGEIYKIADELYQKAQISFDVAKEESDTEYPHCRIRPFTQLEDK